MNDATLTATRLAGQAHHHATLGDDLEALLPIALRTANASRETVELAVGECAFQRIHTGDQSWDHAARLLAMLLRTHLFT